MVTEDAATTEVWAALDRIGDPELPIISIVQLGIVRQITRSESRCTVILSPTFIGCPATRIITDEIAATLHALGLEADVRLSFARPWTIDQVSDAGRKALESAGIALERAPCAGGEDSRGQTALYQLTHACVPCPHCGSEATTLVSAFGPTRCRTQRRCDRCQNLFEQLKHV